MPGAGGEHRPVGDVPDVDVGGGRNQSGLTARKRLQTVDETTEPVRLQSSGLEGKPPLLGVRFVTTGDVEVRADALQRRSQLMPGVGGEPPGR